MRLNNGTAVKKSVASIAVAEQQVKQFIHEIMEHPFFDKIPFITASMGKSGDVKLLPLQINVMINYEEGLNQKDFEQLLEPCLLEDTFCGKEDKYSVMEVLDYLDSVHMDLTKKNSNKKGKYWFYKKQHFFTIIYMASICLEKKIDSKVFYDMCNDFFGRKDTNPEFVKYMVNVDEAVFSPHRVRQRKVMVDKWVDGYNRK
jgi:hypothetical protein